MHDTVPRSPPGEASPAGREGGRWLTVPRLWLVVVLGAIGAMGLARMPSAIDLAYHLKVGQLMVAEQAVPRTDVLAWTTAGRPWLDQNWGAQLVLYAAEVNVVLARRLWPRSLWRPEILLPLLHAAIRRALPPSADFPISPLDCRSGAM